MRTMIAMAVLAMLAAGKLATAYAGEERDRDKIQGTWIVSSGEKAGRKAPRDGLKAVAVTFGAGTFTWTAGADDTRGTFTLDPSKSPHEISLTADGKVLAGVYRLDGDELTLCLGNGADRPVDFTTKPGARTALVVLKRSKP